MLCVSPQWHQRSATLGPCYENTPHDGRIQYGDYGVQWNQVLVRFWEQQTKPFPSRLQYPGNRA